MFSWQQLELCDHECVECVLLTGQEVPVWDDSGHHFPSESEADGVCLPGEVPWKPFGHAQGQAGSLGLSIAFSLLSLWCFLYIISKPEQILLP